MTNTQTPTQNNTELFLLFQSNNGYANVLQCYVTRTVHIFFYTLVGNIASVLSVIYLGMLSIAYCKTFSIERVSNKLEMSERNQVLQSLRFFNKLYTRDMESLRG